ncbi:multicopper oxidase [Lentithecium fluviatile CBS 122367]|uniref:Multicopper oxidase n=1 Tax=Lentithecium fluviatile CBS 122367 TaxID=1168545 RepID=A0A6G1ID23_9PLEO|nr:multicopper oxidase [Lentithecium fluviatile CBS 122367]
MGFSRRSLASFLALLGATPFVGASPVASASLPRTEIAPRQASLPPNEFEPRPGFKCKAPEGWQFCNAADKRECWVRDKNGKEYNIKSDYEDEVPEGTSREYSLEVTEATISPDGYPKLAQLINGIYPGPLIEACWGDTVTVKVKNLNRNNGTTIHWHGLRMFGENHMDGVNGVTQCPIADQDEFTYKFRLRQYGPTWYHSHYSSQYSDGVAAPFLVHGPSSANYTDQWTPIIVADWYHDNAYKAFHGALTVPPSADSILVNGTGRFEGKGSYFTQTFEHDKTYLIRIVNGGTDFHFHFSIDNHVLQVVSADMVPITPFYTNSLSVGIGQRYSVIVHANQTAAANGRYWMRTEYTAGTCQNEFKKLPVSDATNQRVGIISYKDASGDPLPTTNRWPAQVGCTDVLFEPVVGWTVTKPQNDLLKNAYSAGLDSKAGKVHGAVRWELTETPMWLNFSDPTILHLDNSTWNPEYAVEPYNFNDPDGFVYMIINSGGGTNNKFGGTHPIHLHGHDFAIISQNSGRFDPAKLPAFPIKNPPRRDVAMLPANGHLVIAFKSDNPGVWLIHCHIGWHAGSGLALQVIEGKDKILQNLGGATSLDQAKGGCNKWSASMGLPGAFQYADQEDSGI